MAPFVMDLGRTFESGLPSNHPSLNNPYVIFAGGANGCLTQQVR